MDFTVAVMAYYGVGIIIGLVVQGICHSVFYLSGVNHQIVKHRAFGSLLTSWLLILSH